MLPHYWRVRDQTGVWCGSALPDRATAEGFARQLLAVDPERRALEIIKLDLFDTIVATVRVTSG